MESNKVDKGSEWCYWRLSYRRKFFRTLWIQAIFIPMILFLIYKDRIAIVMVPIIIGLFQLIYSYLKWQGIKKTKIG